MAAAVRDFSGDHRRVAAGHRLPAPSARDLDRYLMMLGSSLPRGPHAYATTAGSQVASAKPGSLDEWAQSEMRHQRGDGFTHPLH